MREIKFRFWSNEQHFILYEDDNTLTNLGHLIDSGTNITWGEWCKKWYYDILNDWADWTPMQYTELKDNTKWEQLTKEEQSRWIDSRKTKEQWDGKEIYEGDIVNLGKYSGSGGVDWKNLKGTVLFRDGSYVIDCTQAVKNHGINGYTYMIEVIGNIYENPELMEEK